MSTEIRSSDMPAATGTERAETNSADRSATGSRGVQAFGLAVVIEAAILFGAAAIISGAAHPQPAISEPVAITLVQEEPPKEKPVVPKPLPPLPQPRVKQVVKHVVPPKASPPPPQQVVQQTEPAPAPVETVVPVPSTQPAPKPVPAPTPPVQQSAKGDPSAEYSAKVKAAIEAVHSYPAAAAAMRFTGHARIWVSIRDGVFLEARLIRGCGVGMFDRVALDEAQAAHYPLPPAELRGQVQNYEVNVSLTTM